MIHAWEDRPYKKGKDTVRLCCPICHNTSILVNYGPLKKPKGNREKGLFGECAGCGFKSRLSAGYPK